MVCSLKIITFICFFGGTCAAYGMESQDAGSLTYLVKKTLALKFEYRGKELQEAVEEISKKLTSYSDAELEECLKTNSYSSTSEILKEDRVTIYYNRYSKPCNFKNLILGAACMPLELEDAYEELLNSKNFNRESPDILEQQLYVYQKYNYNHALLKWITRSPNSLGEEFCKAHPFVKWVASKKFGLLDDSFTISVKGYFDPQKFECLLKTPYRHISYGEGTGMTRRQYYVDLVRYLDEDLYKAELPFKEKCLCDWHEQNECPDCLKSGYRDDIDFWDIKEYGCKGALPEYIEKFKDCWSEKNKAIFEDLLSKREYDSIFSKNSDSISDKRREFMDKLRKEKNEEMLQEKRMNLTSSQEEKNQDKSD